MTIKKTGKKKYPLHVTVVRGKKTIKFYVPKQHNFKTSFVDKHGCSLVAMYMALRALGVKISIGELLKWSRKHLKIESKIPLKEVKKAIDHFKPGHAKWYSNISEEQMRKALSDGKFVLFETKDPIHTNPLLYDSTAKSTRNFSYGGKKKTSAKKMIKKRCKSSKYGGCVVVTL